MKAIEITKDNVGSFNVIYDAVTKHENVGGIAGLRKITKLLSKFDEIATLNNKDIYELKDDTKTYNLFLDDSEISDIKEWFDAVKWTPMKAKNIMDAYTLVESAKEVKLQVEKTNPTKEDK